MIGRTQNLPDRADKRAYIFHLRTNADTLEQRGREQLERAFEIGSLSKKDQLAAFRDAELPTPDMQIDDVPENALPPREPGDPVAPANQVPRVDPPVH